MRPQFVLETLIFVDGVFALPFPLISICLSATFLFVERVFLCPVIHTDNKSIQRTNTCDGHMHTCAQMFLHSIKCLQQSSVVLEKHLVQKGLNVFFFNMRNSRMLYCVIFSAVAVFLFIVYRNIERHLLYVAIKSWTVFLNRKCQLSNWPVHWLAVLIKWLLLMFFVTHTSLIKLRRIVIQDKSAFIAWECYQALLSPWKNHCKFSGKVKCVRCAFSTFESIEIYKKA